MTTFWEEIEEFPGYQVSNKGSVRNKQTGRKLKIITNQTKAVYVGLVRDGTQYNRSVAMLVAKSFLPPFISTRPQTSVIHINGDKQDCRVDNLAWRTRSFAIMYHRQFEQRYLGRINQPILDLTSGRIFENSWEPVMEYGVLESGVVLSARSYGKYNVFPTSLKLVMVQDLELDYHQEYMV